MTEGKGIIEPRQSPGRSASACSMLATTSAFRSESPVFCISTVTAIPRTVPSCVSHRKQHLPHLGFGLRIPADQLTELEYHLRLLFGKHVVLSGMPHKRGNPNWGRP